MKKTLLVFVGLFAVAFNNVIFSQTVIFSEDFEGISCMDVESVYNSFGYVPNSWSEFDEDNNLYTGGSTFGPYMSGYGARVIDKTAFGKYAIFYAHHGVSVASEDWLVTPQISIPASGNSELKFYAEADYGYDFKVYVSTSGSSPASFVNAPVFTINENYADTSVTINLNAYSGQSVYIGFEYTTSTSYNASDLYLDDVEVINTNSSAISENEKIDFKIFPNPAQDYIYVSGDLKNQSIAKVYDVNGRVLATKQIQMNDRKLDISGLVSGMYFIEINGVRKKVLVAR